MMDTQTMAARPVQISIDTGLLARIDRDPQTKKLGRSAFIRRAVEVYLEAKRHRSVDDQLTKAFGGQAAQMLGEVEDVLKGQAWPED
jgi:hypothetical protein